MLKNWEIDPLICGMGIAVYAASFAIDYLISEHLFIFKVFLSLIMVIAVIKNCAFDHQIRDAIKYLRGFIFGFLIALAIALTLIEMNFNYQKEFPMQMNWRYLD